MFKKQKKDLVLILVTSLVVAGLVVLIQEGRIRTKVREARIEQRQAELRDLKERFFPFYDGADLVYDKNTDELTKVIEPFAGILEKLPNSDD